MKITIDDIKAQFASVNSINQRFKQVADEFNNAVLYRKNPDTEPNGMDNDLDMQEHDLLNGGVGYFDELFVGGAPLGGDHVWGNITGNIQDQTDLYTTLVILGNRIEGNELAIIDNDKDILVLQAISIDQQQDITELFDQVGDKLADIRVSTDNHTAKSLEIDRTSSTLPEIRLTPQVGTGEPFALVKLDAAGLIANNLLPVTGAYNSLGPFITVTDPAPADNPTIRFPAETFLNGDLFTINVPAPQTDGAMLVIDPGTQLPVTVRLEPGDAVLYVAGSVTNVEGWYGVEKAGAGGLSAFDISYDPTGNIIIQPTSINVDAALTDLDTELGAHETDVANPHAVTAVQTGAPTVAEMTSAIDAVYEALFPIGAVHVHPNPNGVIPGTWVQIAEGTFLMNTVAAADPAGGSNDSIVPTHSHTVTVTDPAHVHGLVDGGHVHGPIIRTPLDGADYFGNTPGIGPHNFAATGDNTSGNNTDSSTTNIAIEGASTGITAGADISGEDPIGKNRPAFKGVPIWERTA